MKFKGIPEGKTHLTRLPGPFFTEVLPQIEDLAELKVVLYLFWRLEQMEGVFRSLRRDDFAGDARFFNGLGGTPEQAGATLDAALQKAVEDNIFLRASYPTEQGEERLYFLNSPRGRAAVKAIEKGDWRPAVQPQPPAEWLSEAPNIYRLYEENIGPLTPMVADALREAEASYPPAWIADAFRRAVENNARRWAYIEAILKRWQEEGRDERQDRQDTEKDRRRYVEGEFSDFIEH